MKNEEKLDFNKREENTTRLEELDKLKSRFFANISHEFRTPLTLILGQTEQLKHLVKRPELTYKFDQINQNAYRLLDLINQLLELAEIEAGKTSVNLRIGDLVSFLRNLTKSFEPIAYQKKLELVFHSDIEELTLPFDPQKLERVFFNLLSNAIKFTPEKGKVSVRAMKYTVDSQIRIDVIDTGIGIRPEKLPFIFDRFYQVKLEQKKTYTGTGIGLALVQELVEMHKGKVSVASEPGEGSTFSVFLPYLISKEEINQTYSFTLNPLHGVESTTARQVNINLPDGSKKNAQILIVEDNVEVREFIREELSFTGYSILQAKDGKEGLQLAEEHFPDLILSDVMMPIMDGYDLVKKVRHNEKISHIPIVLLTAKASENSKLKGLELGVDDYLFKPFSSAELKVRIANLIKQRELLRNRFKDSLIIKPNEVSIFPADQAFMRKTLMFIEENMSNESFSVEILSQMISMSATHLNRKLKALINQTAGKLILSMRMQRSQNLIKSKAGTIADIAYLVGYTNPQHFTRSFKKQFGYPPSDLLKK